MNLLLAPFHWLVVLFSTILSALNRFLVLTASAFGVRVHSSILGVLWMLAVYAVVLYLALIPQAELALTAMVFGLWGVLAVGRAWADNEQQRRRISKKMDNTHPDSLPDLRWRALVSALMLLWLLPLCFERIQHRFHYFHVEDNDHFLGWFWFIVDKTYLSSMPAFLDLYPVHITSIDFDYPAGKWLIMISRLLFYYYVVQSIILLVTLHSRVKDAITAVKTDPDMAVRVGRRAVGPLLRKLAENSPDVEEKQKIIFALGRLGSSTARKPLLALIGNASLAVELREEAILALGSLGGKGVREVLDGLLNHSSIPRLRMRSAEALEKFPDPGAVEPLRRKLKRFRRPEAVTDLEPDADVRDRVVRALGVQLKSRRKSDPQVVSEVVTLMLDRHDPAKRSPELWSATGKGGREDPWKSLLEDPRFRVMHKTGRALCLLGDPRAIVLLSGLLSKHTNPRLLQAGAESLGGLIANVCQDDPDWCKNAPNQQRINSAIDALLRLIVQSGSDAILASAVKGLEAIHTATQGSPQADRPAQELEKLLRHELESSTLNSLVIVNTATALQHLVDATTANDLFQDIARRYRAVPDNDPSRTALWEALRHLNPERAEELTNSSAADTLILGSEPPAEGPAITLRPSP